MTVKLESPAFEDNATIPTRFTGEGEDLSPPLSWSGVPPGTVEFALSCEDPDAPQDEPFVHWLLYHIPASVFSLPEGITCEAHLAEPFQADQGRNSRGNIGYMGPMPPAGHGRHRYQFRLFALQEKIDLPSGASKEDLFRAMNRKTIDSTELVGTYERAAEQKAA